MPKTKSKSTFKVRRVANKEDRKRPSVFMRLKTDEYFKGVALFEPDPELKDNPGYLEYYDHYDQQANQYVPCAGDKCPFCAASNNPSTRALTVWYFPEADQKDQIKVFTMNFGTINDITDEAEEEDGILGKTVRIKRLSDKGDYKIKLTGKPLSKADLKKALKLLEEKFPDGLEAVVERQLVAQMERLKAMEALEDDDDDDEEDVTDEAEDEEEDDDEAEDDDDEDEEDEDESDDDDEDEEESDDDEDEDEEDEEDEEEESDDDEDIVGGEYEVVKVNEKDEIFELKNDDGKVKMWLGEGVSVDYDEVKAGATVSVNATTDDEGDWIITEFAVTKKAKAPRGGKTKTTTKQKGGKGKGRGKK